MCYMTALYLVIILGNFESYIAFSYMRLRQNGTIKQIRYLYSLATFIQL